MRTFTVLVLAALAVAVSARPDNKYTDKYDNINLDEILTNRRLLIPYIKCILDEGRCSAEGKELKAHIAEALQNGCANCTPAQQRGSRRVIAHLINNEQEYWDKLTAKYDPTKKYVTQYEKDLKQAKA